jgi:hypothetical protein
VSFALIVALLAPVIVLAVVARLFWSPARPEAGPDDNWQQHNELRMPSLEAAPDPGHTEVDAAVAAQELGID